MNGSGTTGPVFIEAGGTLGGNLTTGTVTSTGGFVSPGNSPGVLNTGDLTLDNASTYVWEFAVAGAPPGTPGTDFDLVNVTGSVTLNGTLTAVGLTPLLSPVPDVTEYTLIENDGVDLVSGIFTGIPEGGTVESAQGYLFTISYVGGDGNDVTLLYKQRIPGVVDDCYNTLKTLRSLCQSVEFRQRFCLQRRSYCTCYSTCAW